jgi:hypothetical protein
VGQAVNNSVDIEQSVFEDGQSTGLASSGVVVQVATSLTFLQY